MAKNRKIPLLNDSLDMNKLVRVMKRNILYYLIIILLSIFACYAYLRYTPPLYDTFSIIQINEEQQGSGILEIDNIYGQTSTSNIIALIYSHEFLKRSLKKLNLYTCYYLEGKFLTTELYKNSPFFVETKDITPNFYNKDIYIEYNHDKQEVQLEYSLENNITIKHKIKTNTWTQIEGCKIYVNITDINNMTSFSSNKYFFRLLDEQGASDTHILDKFYVELLNPEANTIIVKHTDNNARKTADMVNTICEDFLTYNIEKKQERGEKVLSFIEEQLKIVFEKLDESEKQLDAFKKSNNIKGNIFDDRNNIANNVVDNTQDIDKYNNQIKSLEKVNKQIKSGKEFNAVELISLLSGTSSESMILNFLNGIQQLQKQKELLLYTITPDNQKIKVIDQQINDQRLLLLDFIKSTNERIKNELNLAKSAVKNVESVDINEIELTKLKRIHAVHQNFYDQLISKKAEYMISKAGHITNNIILQKADTPQAPISPRSFYSIVIALILCLLFIIGLTLITYLLDNQIMSINDISLYTEVPVAGMIPVSKQTNKINRFVVENKPSSIITEAFRTLRSNLEFLDKSTQEKKVIAITSTISGEGKTFIAINLGGVFALSGKKVILLDLDLRKPKVHLTFNSNNDHGLSTILIGKDNYKDCIIETEFENFKVLTSGPPPPNPAELANSTNFDNLMEQLKKDFDIIIIDTPPIGIVSDAIFSFKRADLPIYVARANYSKRNFVNNINYINEQKSINKMSIVLNAVEIMSSKYGYGYKGYGYSQYGYGYGYGFGYGYYSYGPEIKKKKKKSILNIFSKE